MYRLDVYVPESHAEEVKAALFSSGAGSLGAYDSCCFSVAGTGQFRPLRGANPYLGSPGEVERVREVKLELIVPRPRLCAALKAMRAAHPYETPAFQYWAVELGMEPGKPGGSGYDKRAARALLAQNVLLAILTVLLAVWISQTVQAVWK